ncbi:class I adenylate-forming enzyme family protein [Mycolicibacterium phlei]|uniref:class I adenylate-forming enzyme family protein n=1 Tax=Mycolicibacterium phlei TaxID=1771 RepID=UPI00025AD6CE|nr:AMP-binding protein [Mycolicibacterium phlei]EID09713.1 AMP-dependent synthetase and ligase [Mycolicibacterium phlei RIVM601174]MBF4191966.1 AMP-dependent synthetase and ligase [Mycolicibacterium phlei]
MTALTVGDIVSDNAHRFPDVVAYRMGERTLTHAELYDRATRLVSAMVAAGVRRQDRIAILSRNSIEFGEVMAATHLSGIILATVNFRLTGGEVRDVINRVRPKIVFVGDEFAPMVADLAGQLTSTPLLVCVGDGHSAMTDYEEFVASGRAGDVALRARPEDIACLIFTSGTTGASKCCILGQAEHRRVLFTMNNEMRSGSDDQILINMPMFHIGAMAMLGGMHARGGTVVLQQQFDPDEAVRLIAEHRITVLHLAPVMLSALLDAVTDTGSLESLHTVVYAAAPMTMNILERALALMPSVGFLNLYGQTEAIVSGLPRELHVGDPEALRSVGFPFPGNRVRIVDDDGADVPVGEAGEIVVQSDSLFRGYWDDQAATLATLRDGWCHTGDVGRFDERGLLYLVDRKKDVIITGGENVYSPEVEDAVLRVTGIAACAVVGAPDERWGEAVCAVVVCEPGADVTLEAVQAEVRQRLAAYKIPRRLVIVDELPVLPSGKVDKKRLRAQVAQTGG